jgi:hypothetical protein
LLLDAEAVERDGRTCWARCALECWPFDVEVRAVLSEIRNDA